MFGKNIYLNTNISHVQSIIGDNIKVRLFKENIDVKIPAYTQDKAEIKIANKGYYINENTRGDLFIIINIINPNKITERERKIYAQLLRVEKQKDKEKG